MRTTVLTLCMLPLIACDKAPRPEVVALPAADITQPGSGTGLPSRDAGQLAALPDAGARDASDEPAEDAEAPGPVAFSRRALLEATAACFVASYDDLRERARALEAAAERWAAAPDDDAASAAARTAWFEAALVFQRVELMRVGPLARAMDPGGRDLRDTLYAYPIDNPCAVDQRIVSEAYRDGALGAQPISARGFAALEYLLFYVGRSNACAAGIGINVSGSWAALGDDALRARRAAYAAAAAQDLRARADEVVEAWSQESPSFRSQFVGAGSGGSLYPDEQSALNGVSNAMFYVEKELKDYKLGWPLGLTPECLTGGTCPEAVESPYARVSTSFMRENLRAFRQVFQGCGPGFAGLGFDDWLDAVGATDLKLRMLAGLSAAEAAVDELSPPMEDAIVSAPAAVLGVHTALKQLTDLLKTEFVSALDLELPMTSEGDND